MTAAPCPFHKSCYPARDVVSWLDEAALAVWQAPRRITPGGQKLYCDVAIKLMLTLRLVFHRPPASRGVQPTVLRLLEVELVVPDHMILSLRGRGFALSSVSGDPAQRPRSPRARQHQAAAVRRGRVGRRQARPRTSKVARTPPLHGRRHRRDRRTRANRRQRRRCRAGTGSAQAGGRRNRHRDGRRYL